jgi:hypothetical protein
MLSSLAGRAFTISAYETTTGDQGVTELICYFIAKTSEIVVIGYVHVVFCQSQSGAVNIWRRVCTSPVTY